MAVVWGLVRRTEITLFWSVLILLGEAAKTARVGAQASYSVAPDLALSVYLLETVTTLDRSAFCRSDGDVAF